MIVIFREMNPVKIGSELRWRDLCGFLSYFCPYLNVSTSVDFLKTSWKQQELQTERFQIPQ